MISNLDSPVDFPPPPARFNGCRNIPQPTIFFNHSSIKWLSHTFTDAVQLREQMLLKACYPVKIHQEYLGDDLLMKPLRYEEPSSRSSTADYNETLPHIDPQ